MLDKVGRERLKRLVEDPDSDPEAASILEEHNLMIRLPRAANLGEAPEPDTELRDRQGLGLAATGPPSSR